MPGGFLFLVVAAFICFDFKARWLTDVVQVYPYLVVGVGLLLGWRFNRSRLFFAIIMLVAVDRALWLSETAPPDVVSFVTNAAALLLPLNFVVLSLIHERGIINLRGWWRLFLIIMQPLVLVFLYKTRPEVVVWLNIEFLPLPLPDFIPLSQASFSAVFVSSIFLVGQWIRTRDPLINGFIWALVSAFFALTMTGSGMLTTFIFSTSGLILVVSVLESAYGMAFRDELTGLPSRRALNEHFLKLPGSYSIAMLDIDFFKKFNDRYGHDVGDQVLKMVASHIARVSGGGKSFRYGGEEFTVSFPGKGIDEVLPCLEKLRQNIESSGFAVRGHGRAKGRKDNRAKGNMQAGGEKQVSVTISIGVAERNGNYNTPDHVVKAADQALYRAKSNGRNQVAV